jgi:hypothetical protein
MLFDFFASRAGIQNQSPDFGRESGNDFLAASVGDPHADYHDG